MRIAIIGSHGYIGSFLYNALHTHRSEWTLEGFTKTDRNISGQTLTVVRGRDIPKEVIQSFDTILYCAGLSGFETCAQHDWNTLMEENVEDVYEVATKMNASSLLIYMSTAVVYDGCTGEASENTLLSQFATTNLYAHSFLTREQRLAAGTLTGTIQTRHVGLRLGTAVGVSPMQNVTRVHIAMLRQAWLQGTISMQYAQDRRPILALVDLTRVVIVMIEKHHSQNDPAFPIYNIASFNTTIKEIATRIVARSGAKLKIQPGSRRTSFAMNCDQMKDAKLLEQPTTHEELLDDLVANVHHLCLDNAKRSRIVAKCRVCGDATNMMSVLDLGEQPLANAFTAFATVRKRFPLSLERCRLCNHTQLHTLVAADELFGHYLYASGTSDTIKVYFDGLAQKCIAALPSTPSRTVLEIASNDGTQLDCFKSRGWVTVGVDPAVNLCAVARAKGHIIYEGFWGVDRDILPTSVHPCLDLILAQNVFAHVPDPIAFLMHCRQVMQPHTHLWIQTSQCDMYTTGQFDTVYHEHVSFFTASSFARAAQLAGLHIRSIEKTSIHGTSFLVCLMISNPVPSESLERALKEENRLGMKEDVFWIRFRNHAYRVADWIRDNFFDLALQGYRLVAYGASAKGMTLLNYVDSTPQVSRLEMIVDDSPLKQNTMAPYKNVPVVAPSELFKSSHHEDVAVLLTAWNFGDEIVNKIRKLSQAAARKSSQADAQMDRHILIVHPFANDGKGSVYELV